MPEVVGAAVRVEALAGDAAAAAPVLEQGAVEGLDAAAAGALPIGAPDVDLQPQPADAAGFRRPFAALALSELARVDRLQPFLSVAERAELVTAAAAYLASVDDYRGFIPGDGWRHGVAHGADLVLQLSLNPAVDAAAQRTLLAAIAAQVMPGGHFYVFGEGGRLMRPVFYIARRKLLPAEEWSTWFAALAARRQAAAPTLAALAADHDLATFVLPLYASLKESPDSELQALLLPGVLAAMKSLD